MKPQPPPSISITGPQESIFDDDTRDFFREWENKYTDSTSTVSQAEFFAPVDLTAGNNASAPRVANIEEDDIPLHPSAPRIVISEPETFETHLSPEEQWTPKKISARSKKTIFLDQNQSPTQAEPRLRQRRHSTISVLPEPKKPQGTPPVVDGGQPRPTPRPWTTIQVPQLRDDWKMKVRFIADSKAPAAVVVVMVYMFNSATIDKLDRDADLSMFSHLIHPESRKAETSPTRTVQRARTDIGKQPHQSKFETPIPSRDLALPQLHAQRSQRRHINWLTDRDMLPQKIPGMHVLTVGFDINSTWGSNLQLETAARQLHDCLKQHRNQNTKAPMIFIGHALGNSLIIRTLSEYSNELGVADTMLLDTAGIFLFSSHASSQTNSQDLASFYGVKPTDKIFNDLFNKSVVDKMNKTARDRLASRHRPSGRSNSVQTEETKISGVSIAFPIFQVFAQGEIDTMSLTTLLGTPVRTITMDKASTGILQFRDAQDPDFLHLSMLMQSTLHTHKILHAAASGRVDDIHSMIRRGMNVNLRDRWSQTALQIAVRMDHEDVVTKLLNAKNVDPNCRDRLSNTPLHYAVRNGNEAIVRALIHKGADIGIENQRKRTPRDLAEKRKSRKHIAKLLKSKLMSGPDQSLSSKLVGSGKPPISEDGILACRNAQITITEIYATRNSDKHWSVSVSIEALLYGTSTLDEILAQVRPQAVKKDCPVCVWIHVPDNNMIWVEDLFAKLRLHPAIWQDTRRSVTDSLRNRAITPHYDKAERQSLFLPYISYEANVRQAKRTTYIQAVDATHQRHKGTELPFTSTTLGLMEGSSRASAGERRPLLQVPEGKNLESYPYLEEDSDSDFSEIVEPDDPDDLEEEEKAMINAYLYNPPALHVRRTLDQYYYHMLESTHDRDIDQVVSRWAHNVVQQPRHNILMVDQLWLWKGQKNSAMETGEAEMEQLRQRDNSSDRGRGRSPDGNKGYYVVSCFPSRTGSGEISHRTLDDLRPRVLDPNSHKRDPVRQPEDLVSRILETCCNAFDRMQDVQMLRFFQMFEDSVGTIDDKESRLFRDFQRGSNRLLELDSTNKYYNANKNALLTDLLDIREEISLLVEVKDIRDEVNIILTILSIQSNLIAQMSHAAEGETPLLRTPVVNDILSRDINDFSKLDSQARTIQEKLNTLMDLKQKAANAWEAKEARETAVAAGKQGNTVLVFTVVTIIFLPLSFMSSFFAIGIAAFPHNDESGEVNWPLGTVTGILFGVSLCVSIPLIVFALNMEYFTVLFREWRYNYLAELGIRIIPLLPPMGAGKDAVAYRRRWTGLLQQQREEYMKNGDLVVEVGGREYGDGVREKGGGGGLPTSMSSHTFVDEEGDAFSLRARKSHRGFRWRKKEEDDESLIGK